MRHMSTCCPHLDRGALSRQIDVRRPSGYPFDSNSLPEVSGAVVSTFLCPSDPTGGGNNYRVCTGSGAYFSSGSEKPGFIDRKQTAGVFGVWDRISPGDVGDGFEPDRRGE